MTDMSTTLLAITSRSSLPRSRSSATISSMYSACMSCLQPEKTLPKYFIKSSFEKGDFETMVYEFNHIEVVVESPRILASFTPEQIRLITKFANESNFFVDGIDEETMDGFFKCALEESLVVVNMRQVLQLLYALSIEKMIPHNWVSLIADNQLLTPKSTGKASKRGAISSRLSELKASSAKFPSGEFLDFAKQLKEMR